MGIEEIKNWIEKKKKDMGDINFNKWFEEQKNKVGVGGANPVRY